MIKIERLNWDSDFFKKEIGKVLLDQYNQTMVIKIKEQCRAKRYDLLYVFQHIKKESDIILNNEFLVDTKVSFRKKVSACVDECVIVSYKEIKHIDISQVYHLAIASGEYSRFKLDPRFKSEDFINLYKKWVDSSLALIIADEIFFYMEDDIILGFVTVKFTENDAIIGLIAVNENYRGRSIGSKLLSKINYVAYLKNCSSITVATQYNNTLACSFYKKNDYQIEELTNIYHIWN